MNTLDELKQIKRQVAEDFGDYWKAIDGLIEGEFADIDDVEEYIQDNKLGITQSLGLWVEEHLEETGYFDGANEEIKSFFDYESYGQNMQEYGEIVVIEGRGELYIFGSL